MLCEGKTLWCAIIGPYLIYPTGHAAIMMAFYTIVVLSFERRHAICAPLTHVPKFWPYFITIVFSSITMTIPLYSHYQLVHDEYGNITVTDCVCKLNVIYNIYFNAGLLVIGTYSYKSLYDIINPFKHGLYDFKMFLKPLLGSIIPMVLLIRNNVMIYLNLRKTKQIERNKTAVVLFATVLVFFICHIIRFVITTYEFIYPFRLEQELFCDKMGR